ncbi:MAG: hypothetical protein JO061_03925, partial [Acidobacteriaceae bacterium]|nr:hypothetical protein [Acidobacteriaceae bacterium]
MERYDEMIRPYLVSLLVFVSVTGAAHCQQRTIPVSNVHPTDVIDISEILQEQLGFREFANGKKALVSRLSEAGGVWAALSPYASHATAIVVGRGRLTHAFTVQNRVEEIIVDDAGRVHVLKHRPAANQISEVSVFDDSGREVDQYLLSDSASAPFLTESGVLWKAANAIVAGHTFIPLLLSAGKRDVNEITPQEVITGSLLNGGYFTFGCLSEVI